MGGDAAGGVQGGEVLQGTHDLAAAEEGPRRSDGRALQGQQSESSEETKHPRTKVIEDGSNGTEAFAMLPESCVL